MASPHSFHERPRALSDMAAVLFRGLPARAPHAPPPYARSPLAVSLDSMVKMAS